jgi:DNA-binding response OmpR family regulator
MRRTHWRLERTYLRKPCSSPVLIARCWALLRRGQSRRPLTFTVDDLVLDPRRRTARRGDTPSVVPGGSSRCWSI